MKINRINDDTFFYSALIMRSSTKLTSVANVENENSKLKMDSFSEDLDVLNEVSLCPYS